MPGWPYLIELTVRLQFGRVRSVKLYNGLQNYHVLYILRMSGDLTGITVFEISVDMDAPLFNALVRG